jgi:hypothetical protein
MKLPQLLNSLSDAGPPRAPQAMLWIPPSGLPVQCPSVDAAQKAATAFSAQKPGTTVAVYQLVGYAFRPIEQPEFVLTDSARARAELHDCAPDTLQSDLPAEGEDHRPYRTDLTPLQQAVVDQLGEASRGAEPPPNGG